MNRSTKKFGSSLRYKVICLVCLLTPAILSYLLFFLEYNSPLLRSSLFSSSSSKKGGDENFLYQLQVWLEGELTDDKKEQEEEEITSLSSNTQHTNLTPTTTTITTITTDPLILAPPEIKNKTKTWSHWPAVAHEDKGHALVYKGETFISTMRESLFAISDNKAHSSSSSTLFDEFLEVYKNRPDKVNKCGILINHALALFFAVKQLKPTLVVESGVNAGQSTYFIRQASPETKIWALDPLEVPICEQGVRWIDQNEKTTYFVGDKFMDVNDFDWKTLSANGTIDVDRTLFFIDDHKLAFSRIQKFAKAGMKHVIIEDNYKVGEGASNEDKSNSTPKQVFFHPQRQRAAKWLFDNLKTYAEFPPLLPPIMAKKAPFERKRAGGFMVWQDTNEDIVAPILRPDLVDEDNKTFHDIAAKLELNPDMTDFYSYKQFMNFNQFCYMELLGNSPGR
jgi:hypothetical protein